MKRQKVQTRGSRLRSISIAAVCCISVSTMGTLPGVSRAQHAHPAGQNTGPTVGAAAVNFDLKTIAGNPVGLETFRGKPLVMNFFASWCDPCRDEMPLINDLASKSTKEGYSVLGIAVEDGRAAVTEYAKEAKLMFPIALDLNSIVKRAYRIFGPPATFFIDGQGVIRDVVIGPITPQRARDGLKKAGLVR
jgi:cytochrome c biogenesis protein CcmG/thiol:disulfide interchange protein DsbE